MSLLELDAITNGYGPTQVNRDASLRLEAGEVVAILGPNGAGKSTLLKTIVGQVQPWKGRITLDDGAVNLTGLSPDVLVGKGIVMVPEGRRIFAAMTVEENLRLGAYARADTRAVDADADRMWDLFPILRDKRSDKGGSLSGGQQQMLAIARGLMARPRVLLLDEPSLGLSPKLVGEIRSIILGIKRDFSASVLLVEQNAGLAFGVAQRGYLMQHGRFALDGKIEDLRDRSLMRDLYLGGLSQDDGGPSTV